MNMSEHALSILDSARRDYSLRVSRTTRSKLGQFLTPSSIADFMAEQLNLSEEIQLLDPGAGIGILSAAVAGLISKKQTLDITCWEIDPEACKELRDTLNPLNAHSNVHYRLQSGDFVEAAAQAVARNEPGKFTHAILNPPYQKIGVNSHYRLALREAGIETVNLYAGFVALALMRLRMGGELVAIIPRSFANGPYYRPFREFILNHSAIARIHLFKSRNQLFQDDAVLQENVIIKLIRGATQEDVLVSTSSDASFHDLAQASLPFAEFLHPGDRERFFHIPDRSQSALLPFRHSLAQIGLEVCTGPVVDFRLKEHLRAHPESGSAPLIYAAHFDKGFLWPRGGKKPDAIMRNDEVERWLMPNACYVVTRRFSSKEERRRIVAHVFPTGGVPGECVAFENHLNVFHFRKRGLDERLARGLAAYLNSTAVDKYFRQFSGHTQVNATDLRNLPYPSNEQLLRLGQWSDTRTDMSQAALDVAVERLA